jgi:hypothetical protein
MNFLALVTNAFKSETSPKATLQTVALPPARPVTSSAVAIARPLERQETPYNVPQAYSPAQVSNGKPRPRQDPWDEPKRIQRFRNAARTLPTSVQIEGHKVSGMWCALACDAYDALPEHLADKMIILPMPELERLIKKIHAAGGVLAFLNR